jgi:hypothetical protein
VPQDAFYIVTQDTYYIVPQDAYYATIELTFENFPNYLRGRGAGQ